MSGNLNYKQVTNVTRRTWDVETYAKKATDRQQKQNNETGGTKRTATATTTARSDDADHYDDGVDDEKRREEFAPAALGAVGPEGSQRAYLKARKHKVIGIDDKIGSTEIFSIEAATKSKLKEEGDDQQDANKISSADVVKKTGVGWHCTVCDCFLKDSHTYLDHINGRKHQRALGYSMRVERSSKEQLLSKLKQLTNDQNKYKNASATKSEVVDFHDIVKQKDEEERVRKEERQRQRKERRRKMKEENKQQCFQQLSDDEDVNEKYEGMEEQKDQPGFHPKKISMQPNEDDEELREGTEKNEGTDEHDDDEIGVEGIDPAMAAMMGFTGFGGSKK